MIWTVLSAVGCYLYIIVAIIPVVIISLFDPTGNLPHILARYWARFTLWCANVSAEVLGKENIPEGPAIFMPNHQSHFDVFALLGHLEAQFRWTAKKELFRIPLLGLGMRRIGYILIDRSNHAKALEGMNIAAEKIRSGTSIMIFPEGTRSPDGNIIYPFKKGGFHLALKAHVPIVPVSVCGSRNILPKHSTKVTPGKITVVVGTPIYPDGHTVASLMEEVYNAINLGYTH
ncbi:MAG: lysophospholipid acyltransferase family protein [Desulfomonilia bacterium]|nr:lysophospholipid acyltransferase family protein [Desulfomonilia bacterium]